jgi:hypothetical protein
MRDARASCLASLLMLGALGCRGREGKPASMSAPASAPVSAVEARLEQRGSVSFRSFDGQALALDSDTEITLYRDRSAHMFEHGFRDRHYRGRYTLAPDGRLAVTFHELRRPWPVMHLREEGGRLRLHPESLDAGAPLGNREAAAMPRGGRGFWPFAMLSGEDERQLLRRIQ